MGTWLGFIGDFHEEHAQAVLPTAAHRAGGMVILGYTDEPPRDRSGGRFKKCPRRAYALRTTAA
jgi:hypothetical protein